MRYTAAYNTIKLANKFENKLIKKSSSEDSSKWMDYIHLSLDFLGLIPGFGEVFDTANAVIYLGERKWMYAALSVISMIPAIGDAIAKGGKFSIFLAENFPKVSALVGKHADKIKKVSAVIVGAKNLFESKREDIIDFLNDLKTNGKNSESSISKKIDDELKDKLDMSRNEIIDKLIDELDNIEEALDAGSRLTSELK